MFKIDWYRLLLISIKVTTMPALAISSAEFDYFQIVSDPLQLAARLFEACSAAQSQLKLKCDADGLYDCLKGMLGKSRQPNVCSFSPLMPYLPTQKRFLNKYSSRYPTHVTKTIHMAERSPTLLDLAAWSP